VGSAKAKLQQRVPKVIERVLLPPVCTPLYYTNINLSHALGAVVATLENYQISSATNLVELSIHQLSFDSANREISRATKKHHNSVHAGTSTRHVVLTTT